ncbi:MAG: hypothetical protein HY821_08425 [Acidobacteria bacterium]|nr:hypothetical protein [Acidobacteriota bacterium]
MRNTLIIFALTAVPVLAQVSGPIVTKPTATAVTAPLGQLSQAGLASLYTSENTGYIERDHRIAKGSLSFASTPEAPLVTVPANAPYSQNANYLPLGTTSLLNFEAQGLGTPSFIIAGAPPDTTLGVSPTQIVQWVNTSIAIYDKAGNPLLPAPGFVNGNAIWAALPAGSLCRDYNRGDPLVQYDRFAGRWILSQFAFNASFTQNAQCFAVSTTNNALGSYNLYEYSFGNALPDYGKLGVWHDAYYLSYNMFTTGQTFAGGRACAYDRAAMIAGAPATSICFNSTARSSFLPSDADGPSLPAAGTPNYLISWNWWFTAPPYTMQLTKFKPDFVTPASSLFNDGFGGAVFSFVGFDLGSNTLAACNDQAGGISSCVPQLGTAQMLDTLGDRHMYRLVYRNFGTFDALLFTQAVDNVAGSTAQLRWWEIRNPGANPPVVYQNSTFAPDTTARWMSSAAFDKLGNIAIGYSASSASINPGIRVAGRRRTDPKNLLRAETIIQAGTGSQTGGLDRWGDYSTMQIDPSNDCTFWYTTQYIGANGSFNWRTRIAGFKFPNCTP